MNNPQLFSLTKLSQHLGIGRRTLYDWLYAEQMPPAAKIINGRRYWTAEQVENFLQGKSK